MALARIIQEKKGEDVVVLDLRKISNITDFFVICSGNSTRQVKAISDYLIERAKQSGYKIWHIEGYRSGLWILLDCQDVVVHLFHRPIRDFYDLQRLWGDAPTIGARLSRE